MNTTWAVNAVKLNRAIADVTAEAKLDTSVKVTEDTVKARYIELGGAVQETSVVAKKVKRGAKKEDVEDDEDEDTEDDK